jgi:hypothetical protein
MRIGRFLLLLLIPVLVAGCNLGSSERETEEPLPTLPADSGQPQVLIVSPQNGDTFDVDEQILVNVQATDAVGVTRVQLFADGQIVKTISSESLNGETQFSGVLDFTPRIEGEYTLRVLAFRGAIASSPAEVTVDVSEEADSIVVTSRPDSGTGSGSTGPIIPNDGLCRVLTNVGLNMRSEPTTTRENILTVLPSGTLLLVTARLGDNSWWKVAFNNSVGWVSGNPQFTTLYGNCTAIPVETFVVATTAPTLTNTPPFTATPTLTRTPTITPTPGRPDLLVASITGTDPVVLPGGATEVVVPFTLTVTNAGLGPSSQFVVLVRVDSQEYELVVSNLGSGQTIALTQDIRFTAIGEVDIRVDVDPDNLVQEVSDVNNRGDLTVEVVGG